MDLQRRLGYGHVSLHNGILRRAINHHASIQHPLHAIALCPSINKPYSNLLIFWKIA